MTLQKAPFSLNKHESLLLARYVSEDTDSVEGKLIELNM